MSVIKLDNVRKLVLTVRTVYDNYAARCVNNPPIVDSPYSHKTTERSEKKVREEK